MKIIFKQKNGTRQTMRLGVSLMLGGLFTFASANAALAGDAVLGREVAQKLCVNCHIVEDRRPENVNPDVPSFIAIAEKPGQSEDAIHAFLIDPHYPMPNIQLTSLEVDNIASYIMSLAE